MLQALCRCYVHSDETDEEVKTLVGTAVRLMAGVLRPLGSVLTSLPLGPDHPGPLAGSAFYMVDPSQFVLPYWEAAWKVMVQRLGEMADACARLGLEAGLGQIAKLEPNVRAIAAGLQPEVQQGGIAHHLDPLAVGGQPAVEDPQDVGERAAQRDGGLLVAAAPGEAVRPELDEPLGPQARLRVGRVEVDAPARTAQLRKAWRRPGDLRVADQLQQLVDGVCGQLRGDGVVGVHGAGRVGAVDHQVIGRTAGPEGGAPLERPDLRFGTRACVAQRAGELLGRVGEPGVQRRRVVTVRTGRVGNLPAWVLHGPPGPHGRLDRPEVAADVPDEPGERPVGAGRYGQRQVSPLEDVSEQAGLGDDLVAVAVVRQRCHRGAMVPAGPDRAALLPPPDHPLPSGASWR